MNTHNHVHSFSNQLNTGRHAVVIGGSMAGLLTARVLTDYFEQVSIIDRDTFPEVPEPRKGVPQSYHAHALHEKGQEIINRLFPGILDELRAGGASSAYGVMPTAVVTPTGKLPLVKQDGESLGFSRLLLEWQLRRRLVAQAGVYFLTNRKVTGLLSTPDRARVIGVRLHHQDKDASPEMIQADLVVDASGRYSKAPEWLVELGYAVPPEESVNSGTGYASRIYAKPTNFPAAWQHLVIFGHPPHNPRSGFIMSNEHNKWHVSLVGSGGNYPPTNEAGFLQWAHDLSDPSLYEAIRFAEPLSPIQGFRVPQTRLRHFERLDRWPTGFIVTGDSVCAFNPVYGQGTTVIALEALVLDECLRHYKHCNRQGFERLFQQQLAKTVAGPWFMSSSEDLRWSGVKLSGARPRIGLGILHHYMNLVLKQACDDPKVTQAYLNVVGMMVPPQSLMQPNILLRVFWGAIKSINQAATSNPANPEQFPLLSEAFTLHETPDKVR
ncbi:MAG: 2-polyprenyl-6-methoxyphenol hydroxylase-like oxidoreductase [Spirirestis rafaelensis WJT71-NPBG6]|jgi:2-polyprenyl-6-methoxyphenol hydroxylase-like FAD-dependent oxidoreductase|nr:2-polyprenyl-6-methoxyphenol hydroxylase-like oxidoreductase [Spirirestis rafaelensis WJT71-NPBG6]